MTQQPWANARGIESVDFRRGHCCREVASAHGYVPPDGKKWVDHICKHGNEANHQIVVMEQHDATEPVSFTELLLKFVYGR